MGRLWPPLLSGFVALLVDPHGRVIAGFPSFLSAWPLAPGPSFIPSLPINSVNIVHQVVHHGEPLPTPIFDRCQIRKRLLRFPSLLRARHSGSVPRTPSVLVFGSGRL